MESKTLAFLRENISTDDQKVLDLFELELKREISFSIEEQLNFFINGYCKNCGISYGYRSVYWDLGTIVLQNMLGADTEETIDEYAKKYVTDWSKYESYDAGAGLEETIVIAFSMFYFDEIEDQYKPLFCKTLLQFIIDADILELDEPEFALNQDDLLSEWNDAFEDTDD